MQTLTVTPNEAGQRMDKLLAKYLDQAGKGFPVSYTHLDVYKRQGA